MENDENRLTRKDLLILGLSLALSVFGNITASWILSYNKDHNNIFYGISVGIVMITIWTIAFILYRNK